MDYAAEAKRHREMAEEYRTMAECTPEDSLRTHYRNSAEGYARLADVEVRIDLKFSDSGATDGDVYHGASITADLPGLRNSQPRREDYQPI